jgi:hypothetical protein
VAHLPVRANEHSEVQAARVRALIDKGWTTHQIASKLSGNEPKKYKVIRAQLRRILATDDRYQVKVGLEAKGALIEGTVDMADAMVRRASKGNVPAAKLAMEMSGFHNPRVDHHHSGKIEIELKGVHRPPPVVDESEAITDAEVVE